MKHFALLSRSPCRAEKGVERCGQCAGAAALCAVVAPRLHDRRSHGTLRRMLSSPAALLSASPKSLTSAARDRSDTAFPKSHAVKYVARQASELDTSSNDQDNDDGADAGAGDFTSTANTAAATVEPSVVDFTTDVAPAKLDRLYHRADKGVQLLSSAERRMFTKMIYDAVYKGEGTTAQDPSMIYQAALEIQWIEEWMAAVSKEKKLSTDEARREVKRSLLERVDLQKPLSYIIGSQPFFGCNIRCEEPLLCPRPETEMWTHWLVYNYLKRLESHTAGASVVSAEGNRDAPIQILDVCCGTGCIGVALAKHVPTAVVTALDILPQAVTVSQGNAQRNGVPDMRYTAIQSDMFDCFLEPSTASPASHSEESTHDDSEESDARHQHHRARAPDRPLGTLQPQYVGTFDVIVSNPPYVLPNQYVELPCTITHWESKTALVGDDYRESRQYLYFKELCVHGAKLLKPRHQRPLVLQDTPNMLIEVGLQAHMVAELMEKRALWKDVTIHLDYAQQERWVSAVSAH